MMLLADTLKDWGRWFANWVERLLEKPLEGWWLWVVIGVVSLCIIGWILPDSKNKE